MGFVFVCVFRMRFPRDRFVHSRRYSRRRFFVYTYLSASTVSGVRAHALRCSSHLFFPASSYAHSCCMRYMRFLCAARSINGYVHRRVRLRRLHCCGAQPERSIARVGDLPLRGCVWCVAINNARAIPLSICQEQPFNAYILWASGVYAHNTYAGARAIPHTRKQSVLSLSVSRWLQDQPKWPIKNGCLSVLTFTCMCVLLLPACLPATVTQRFMYCLMVSLSHFVVHIRLHAHTAHTHTHSHCPLTTNALWCERVRQYTLRSGLVPIRRRQNDDSAAYASSERISLCWFAMAHFEVRMNGIVSLQVICIASARKVATTWVSFYYVTLLSIVAIGRCKFVREQYI